MTSVQKTVIIFVVNVYKIFEKKILPRTIYLGIVNYHLLDRSNLHEVKGYYNF
jgi:hypothetical protein